MNFNKSRASLLLAGASFLTLAQFATAQETITNPQDRLVGDTVIVTGTRQTERTVFDSMAPVDVVSSGAVDSAMSEDLQDTLAQLVPSYKVERNPMADGNVFVRSATLRGLGRNQLPYGPGVPIPGGHVQRGLPAFVRGAYVGAGCRQLRDDFRVPVPGSDL